MKKIMVILVAFSSIISACPTCVGRIEHDSPAFFKDEFYQPTKTQNTPHQTESQDKNPSQEDEE